ncbi:Uncharacterised protein [Mycobacteroides abscessus]|nr:Uncharacterised protein [Mycobacteroides abscessus]
MAFEFLASDMTNRPPPNKPMAMAVVMIIATVIVTLRRRPVTTSLNRNPKRMFYSTYLSTP